MPEWLINQVERVRTKLQAPPDPDETRREVARSCAPYIQDKGYAVTAIAPQGVGPSDQETGGTNSQLIVLEDGVPLPHPHASHQDIRTLGAGRFSHWGEHIYFSSSDHTDPNENGRRYEVARDDTNFGPVSLFPALDGLRFVHTREIPRYLLRKYPLALKHCRGEGIEIGGTSYNTIAGLNATNISRRLSVPYLEECKRQCHGYVRILDFISEGDDLPLDDASVDFVYSSHVLEHFPDPIKALVEWDRVLRVGGTMFAIVPHKERTFDRDKPRTPLPVQFERYRNTPTGPAQPDTHYSIWITQDLVNLIQRMTDEQLVHWHIEAVEDQDTNLGNGFAIACRKVR